MTRIDAFSLATVPFEVCANGQAMADATGFAWKHGEQLFLITNWHVVSGRNAQTGEQDAIARPDMLRVLFNPRIPSFGKVQYQIAIRDDEGVTLWFTHRRDRSQAA